MIMDIIQGKQSGSQDWNQLRFFKQGMFFQSPSPGDRNYWNSASFDWSVPLYESAKPAAACAADPRLRNTARFVKRSTANHKRWDNVDQGQDVAMTESAEVCFDKGLAYKQLVMPDIFSIGPSSIARCKTLCQGHTQYRPHWFRQRPWWRQWKRKPLHKGLSVYEWVA